MIQKYAKKRKKLSGSFDSEVDHVSMCLNAVSWGE